MRSTGYANADFRPAFTRVRNTLRLRRRQPSGPGPVAPGPGAAGRGRFARLARRALVVLTVLVVLFAVATARLLVWPTTGMPAKVSAIVMLAGPGEDSRLAVAVRLAREQRAPVLVVSQGHLGYGGPCPAAPAGVRTVCFDPVPSDTRGEAQFVGKLARRSHWSSVVLVTTRPQDTRARMLMERCFSGPVYVVTAGLPLSNWPYQIAYGWGALLKAVALYRTC
ncbi:MAG TPA: YdcF family protein [Trebonia sp.]|nr:YdcF family protein [Trebonia sp.]